MKLSDLAVGMLFQFARGVSSDICMVIRPTEGIYRVVGTFALGEPLPFCPLAGCKMHGQICKTELPGRRVRRLTISEDSHLCRWLTERGVYVSQATTNLDDKVCELENGVRYLHIDSVVRRDG